MKYPVPDLTTFHVETICAGRLRLTLNWSGQQLVELGLGWNTGQEDAQNEPLSDTATAVQTALQDYVAGRPVIWPELPLAFELCTPFTRDVLTALRTVPAGTTVTYGELAAMAGRPNAARGVGQIMRRNRWPLIVPCHRVIGSTGAMVGFSGRGGIPLKEYLLQLETKTA